MRALASTLRESGFSVRGFTSPRAALAELRARRFDVLLTDLRMPEIDGVGLLSAALALDPELVVIVMTGHGTIDTAVGAMQAGALDYILKPFKLSAILPVLDRALAVGRLRRDNAALLVRVRERTAELEAANKELDAFSYSVSHDLRSPLRHIQGYAEMLARSLEGKLEGKQPHYMSVILDSTRRMGALIDNLLEFARLGRAELRIESVDMERLARDCIGRLGPETEGREVEWKVGKLPRAQGDPSLLAQVMMNLLSNALKYTRTRAQARIEIDGGPDGEGMAAFRVKDNGVGFDMQYAGRLFGVFQRMHRESEFEGTGIGLANVRSIVHRHGGKVRAEAEPDRGAVFHFTLRPSEGGGRGIAAP
jgi:signal transduction histidine kinase